MLKDNNRKRYEIHSGVFIVNICHSFSTVSIADFEQVNAWWVGYTNIKIMTLNFHIELIPTNKHMLKVNNKLTRKEVEYGQS